MAHVHHTPFSRIKTVYADITEEESRAMGYLKGKSSLMIFDRHANLKYKFGNRHFWAEGYYVSTVGLNEATIKKYIQEQEKQAQHRRRKGIKRRL